MMHDPVLLWRSEAGGGCSWCLGLGGGLRWDAGAGQHLGLHGVQTLALAHAQLDLDPVVGVVLEEDAVADDKLGVGAGAVEDVHLRAGGGGGG